VAFGKGHVYVADTNNDRIQQYTASGELVDTWGGFGEGAGDFDAPSGVAVAANGQVSVVEELNRRIQQFTATGTFVRQWGVNGGGDGQFTDPWGVAVGNGHIYIADTFNHRIVRVRPL
jgi:hypothetical protein